MASVSFAVAKLAVMHASVRPPHTDSEDYHARERCGLGARWQPERFRAKWIPVRVKKTRQNKNLEPRSDFIGTGL
jgi:hypothetical protein